MLKIILILLFNFFIVFAYGNNNTTCLPGQSCPKQNQASTQPALLPDLCPEPDQLVKKDLFWGAPGGWVSYDESPDIHIMKFIGAAWSGINIGKVTCVYHGDNRFSFPIILEQQYNKPVPSPTGGQWIGDKEGHQQCLSNNVKDCPFFFEKPSKPENIYEQLQFFKGKKTDDNY